LSALATAYIGLGANLGEREATLREAVRRLGTLGTVTAVSSLYETEPVGYRDQPPFLNAVVALETALPPGDVMRGLLAIEETMGRVRTFRNAPRTLDLDLLLYDDIVLENEELVVPHPRFHERAFVLVPLAEIAPLMRHPAMRKTFAELLADLPGIEGVRRVAPLGWQITERDGARRPGDR
jgi:2-amino-4-hydroxy-6-hydroxymethyldihydropteridine diphosphokinase